MDNVNSLAFSTANLMPNTSQKENDTIDIAWSFRINDLVMLQDKGDLHTEALARVASESINGFNTDSHAQSLLPLRMSLFPFFPPSFRFTFNDDIDYSVLSESVKDVMIWQITNTTPRILKNILIRSGFKFTKYSDKWIGTWAKSLRAYQFQKFAYHQKFNHFPGTFQIGRKDRLWRTIYRMQQLHSRNEFAFVPDTFIFPSDNKKLKATWKSSKIEEKWIIKPPTCARGNGIYVIHKLSQLPRNGLFVVQRYLSNPYLINETKFDLRIYVYVSTFDPLRIFVYQDGLVRFAAVKYSNNLNSLNNRYIHLTNSTVNKNHESYVISEGEDSWDGHKWSLKALWRYLQSRGIDTSSIWNSMVDLIVKTIISCEPSVRKLSKDNVISSYTCHEIFGFDILLDDNLNSWLMEVNVSPSLDSSSTFDKMLKGNMMAELLNLAGYKIPLHLSRSGQANVAKILGIDCASVCLQMPVHLAENDQSDHLAKQKQFANVERHVYLDGILENLTQTDIFYLIEAEDELNRCVDFQRVFPLASSTKYYKYFNSPSYFNNLLDAWEFRYHNKREDGRQLLREVISRQRLSGCKY